MDRTKYWEWSIIAAKMVVRGIISDYSRSFLGYVKPDFFHVVWDQGRNDAIEVFFWN